MTYWNGTGWEAEVSADTPRRRPARRLFSAAAEATLITLLIFGLIAGTTLGAKGGGNSSGKGPRGSTATISVTDGVFASTTTATVSPAGLWVYAACYQGGSMVYGQYVQSDATGQAVLHLGPTSWWSGGSANCVAEAGSWSARNGQWAAQGSTTFAVAG